MPDPAIIAVLAAPVIWIGAWIIGADAIAYYLPRAIFILVAAWVAVVIVLGWFGIGV